MTCSAKNWTDADAPLSTSIIAIEGRAERILLTRLGYLLVYGWLADEGHGQPEIAVGSVSNSAINLAVLRYKRPDVELVLDGAPHDFGYMIFARLDVDQVSGKQITVTITAAGRKAIFDVTSTLVSDLRLLEDVLAHLGSFQAHYGREASIRRFLIEGGKDLLMQLHQDEVGRTSKVQQVVRFGQRRPGPTFQTVLFGAMEAAMFQPLLFARAGVQFGEWTYVCNSPGDADELVRYARAASNLYDLPIRVVVLAGNAGFGGANNAAMTYAAETVMLINPDVHVMPADASRFNEAIQPQAFGTSLRGALLFYEEGVLMHGGMYLDEDVAFGSGHEASAQRLLRVEHFNKGMPFVPSVWESPRAVPAITGAVMTFGRQHFERTGGFSNDFIFGHYEDADLSLRWGADGKRVEVDPKFRLIHLEGQGSKTRFPHFHGASLVNRYIFDGRNRHRAWATAAVRADVRHELG